jgi:hypothetical protein
MNHDHPAMETQMQRLSALGEWADKSGYSRVTIATPLLLFAVSHAEMLEAMLEADLDLVAELTEPAAIDAEGQLEDEQE